MRTHVLILTLLFFIQTPFFGQFSQTISEKKASSVEVGKHQCGTPPPDAATRKYIFEEIISKEQERALMRNDVTDCLPVKVHIVRETGGTGGLSLGDLAIAIANLNYVFYDANIEFFVCGAINYIDDSDFYEFDETSPDNDVESTFCTPHEVTDAINVFFMDSIKVDISGTPIVAAGYAYFPNNTAQSNRIFMMRSVADNAPNSTFSHELGHYFSLYHTHQDTEFGNTDPDAERVVRTGGSANCSTDGDLLCDTDADPRYSSGDFDSGTCSYTGTATDDLSVTYTPTTAINNIMSYYPDACGGVFTAGQFTRIASGLTTRKGYSSPVYDYSCSAASVTAASGMTATESSNVMNLSWTDNASNELGYIIERSTTSSTSGFLPLIYGGVAENITSFTDSDLSSNTTYYYRVRPVNSACDNYSNVATVTTGLLYALPNFSTGCGILSLKDFELDGNATSDISNINSGCSSGAYGDFTGSLATVTAGSSYNVDAGTLTGTCFGTSYDAYITIWADWNQDGDFDDTDERLLTGDHSIQPCFSGSVSVPAAASNGSTTMRVIINYLSAPNDPSGSYTFGEAEDYSLTVTGGLPIELTSFSGGIQEENILLEWRTATETNNEYFTLEKSSDGIYFSEIATVDGAGNSNIPLNYNFTDDRPFFGENYYRLKQTDFDGKFSYSSIIVISNSKEKTLLNIFPNPVRENEITLSYFSPSSEKVQVQIFDVMGKTVNLQELEVVEGNNNFFINVNELSEGIYFLKTFQKNKTRTIKFVRL